MGYSLPVTVTIEGETPPPTTEFPWLLLIGGVLGVGAVATLIRRKKKMPLKRRKF